jgi:hypothetical protein
MARMIPPLPDAENPSAAELRIFDKLRTETNRDWFALHSLGLTSHTRKPWAEIDFVLIGPTGIFCLEVKGGRVARNDGHWHFTDRNDVTHSKREGPFEQVGRAAAALYAYLVSRVPKLSDSITGYGVVTPDITFSIEGPDVEPRIVFDINDCNAPFSKYIARLVQVWRTRFPTRTYVDLDGPTRGQILELLRGDFDLRPSLQTLMGLVDSEFIRLTERQCSILDGLVDNPRAIIRGGAGTGKTMLALDEARKTVHGERTLLCCSSRLLSLHLAEATRGCDGVTVQHFHGLMKEIISRSDRHMRADQTTERTSDAPGVLPRLCIEAIVNNSMAPEYDTLIIDEAQDLLTSEHLDVFDLILKGGLKHGRWRVFYDPNQDLFSTLELAGLERLINFGAVQYRLIQNCRNTAPIGLTTALVAGVEPDQVYQVQGPQVRHNWYRTDAEQLRAITDELSFLLTEKIPLSGIVLLSNQKLSQTVLARSRSKLLQEVIDLTANTPSVQGSSAVRFCTIAEFKGLEADAVIVFGIDDLSHTKCSNGLYVGASRAKLILSLVINESARTGYESRARQFGEWLKATTT